MKKKNHPIICFIGAGSLGFTQKLIRDILLVPELRNCALSLHDIDAENLRRAECLVRKDIDAFGLDTSVSSSLDRKRALEGAHYVINCTRIGGLDAFALDIEIPLKYGIDQCVGDTLCAGGIMYAQRNIPQILAFCRDIRDVAAANAWFLNYANPMAMNTWAAIDRGGVNTVGLCHGVQHSHHLLAQVLGVEPGALDHAAVGINHQTWFVDLRIAGRRVEHGELLAALKADPEIAASEKVRIDVLQRFGCWSTESNGHLSEYLPWYRKRRDRIDDWIGHETWIQGETGGYLRECRRMRADYDADYEKLLAADVPPLEKLERSLEHGSHIIQAMETGRPYRGHFNVKNHGAIPNLPDDAVVELRCHVDRLGIHVPRTQPLPPACAATCSASINVQRLAVMAAIEGDPLLLKQAMLHDPLCGAVCEPAEIWAMTDELIAAQSQWLPQYAGKI